VTNWSLPPTRSDRAKMRGTSGRRFKIFQVAIKCQAGYRDPYKRRSSDFCRVLRSLAAPRRASGWVGACNFT